MKKSVQENKIAKRPPPCYETFKFKVQQKFDDESHSVEIKTYQLLMK